MELLVPPASQKKFLTTTAPFSFLMVAGLKNNLHKLAHVSRPCIWKKIWRAQYSYWMLCLCLGIIMNMDLYEDKYFVNYFLKTVEPIIICITWSIDARCSWRCTSSQFSSFFNCTEALFYKSKINSYGIYIVNKETRKEDFVHF